MQLQMKDTQPAGSGWAPDFELSAAVAAAQNQAPAVFCRTRPHHLATNTTTGSLGRDLHNKCTHTAGGLWSYVIALPHLSAQGPATPKQTQRTQQRFRMHRKRNEGTRSHHKARQERGRARLAPRSYQAPDRRCFCHKGW